MHLRLGAVLRAMTHPQSEGRPEIRIPTLGLRQQDDCRHFEKCMDVLLDGVKVGGCSYDGRQNLWVADTRFNESVKFLRHPYLDGLKKRINKWLENQAKKES